MSALRDMRPDEGCDRISYEDIAAAKANGDAELLALYARNLLCALEQLWPMAERAREVARDLDNVTRSLDR